MPRFAVEAVSGTGFQRKTGAIKPRGTAAAQTHGRGRAKGKASDRPELGPVVVPADDRTRPVADQQGLLVHVRRVAKGLREHLANADQPVGHGIGA